MGKINKKILIVEDSKSYLWILSQSFIQNGFTVATAENGEDGLATAKKVKPDIILSDIVMPKMDGLAMAGKLREANIDVPIIFLSNMSDVKHISDATETASGYIIKSDENVDGIVAKVKEKLNLKEGDA